MTYQVHTISSKEELKRCPVFEISHFLWTCKRRPASFGRMGYLSGKGLYVELTCLESGPKRECRSHRDMVCFDSAMEAFFTFPSQKPILEGPPPSGSLYLNFEVNANGAMYAAYGHARQGRQFFTEGEYGLTGVAAYVEPEEWSARLLIPFQLLERVCGVSGFDPGYTFFCNFYKISEDPAIEHYAAFSPIVSETPDFHLPEFFARAVII